MRYFLFFLVPLVAAAQPAEPDQRITQALITEMRQLRLAIERSTLLGARTQLAISQLQLQEATIARLTQQRNDAQGQATGSKGHRSQLAEMVKDLEKLRQTPEFATPPKRDELDSKITQMKLELEQADAFEVARAAREGEVANQLQAAQNAIADSRSRIAEMERALDTAIQQLLKEK
jgi:hypothetical protein